jgi:ribosome-associated toxin RatA of RatAB toxin-antitoxin module
VTVAAPVELVTAVARDVAGQPQWWPGMVEAEVLRRDEEERCDLARVVDEVARVGRDEFRLRYTHGDGVTAWRLVGRSAMQRAEHGRWTFRRLDDASCEVTLSLEIETSLPLPRFLQQRIVRNVVRGASDGLRARCEAA